MGYLTDMLGSRAVEVVNANAKSGRRVFLIACISTRRTGHGRPGDEAESKPSTVSRQPVSLDGGTQKTYQRMVQEMELQSGAVLEALPTNGLAENTIVIFTSDNGGERFADIWPFTAGRLKCSRRLAMAAIISWPALIPQGRTAIK